MSNHTFAHDFATLPAGFVESQSAVTWAPTPEDLRIAELRDAGITSDFLLDLVLNHADRATDAGCAARMVLRQHGFRTPPEPPRPSASFSVDARSAREQARVEADEAYARRDRTNRSVERVNLDRLMRARPTSR